MQTRRIKGFAVVERPDGALIWGTLRHDRAAAWSAFLDNNPQIEGFPTAARTHEVEIFIHESLEGESKCDDQQKQSTA